MSDSAPASGPRRPEFVETTFTLRVSGTSALGPEAAAYIESEIRRLLVAIDPYGVSVGSVVLTPVLRHRDGDLEPALRASLR